MDEQLKNDLKKLARHAEVKVARSLLSLKYKKDGTALPGDAELEHVSRRVADQANDAIARTGKTLWMELKNAYRKKTEPGEDSES